MWKNIDINTNQVKYDTGNSSLIKFPNSKKCFWLSNKCVRSGKHDAALNIGINTEFEYLGDDKKTKYSGEYIIESFSKNVVVGKQYKSLVQFHNAKKVDRNDADIDTELYR